LRQPSGKKREIHLTLILFLFLQLQTSFAQKNPITFYDLDSINGSPLGKITGITQDPNGYMWFCGQGQTRLYRYDGSSITSYKHDNKNENSLGFNFLLSLYADDEGNIWIGGGGLDRFNPVTGTFTHYRHNVNDSCSLLTDFVYVILKDHKGFIWVGTSEGLDRLDPNTGKFTHYRNDYGNPKSLSNNTITSLYEDRKGVLWVGTGSPFIEESNPATWEEGGLNRMEADGTFTRYRHDPKNPHSLINNQIGAIFEDSRGNFWIGTAGDGLQTMDRERGLFERHLFDPLHPEQLSRPEIKQGDLWDHITFICEDSMHNIWIGTYNQGISRYDPLTKKISRYKSGNGFPDSTTWTGMISRDNNLWVGTEGSHKLFRADPGSKPIPFVKSGNVHGFLDDRHGSIWVGTDGGLLQYDENNNLVHQFTNSSVDTNSILCDTIFCLYKNPREDTIWLGTKHGVCIFNVSTKKFSRLEYKGKEPGWFDYRIIQITEDWRGVLWIGAIDGGLLTYDMKKGQSKQWISDPKDSTSIGSSLIVNVFEDREKNIWVGTIAGPGGICKLDSKTGKFKQYLPGVAGVYLYEDQEGDLWAGMETSLFRYNRKEDSFSPFFDSQSEISSKRIYGITEDADRNLWLSSPSAIVKIEAGRKGFFIYDNRFGIVPETINPKSFCKTSRGQILVGSATGFYAFFPQELISAVKPLKLLVTEVFFNRAAHNAGEDSSLLRSIQIENSLSLVYNQNSVGFKFIAFDYSSTKAIRYYTMLENFDPDWHETGIEKSVYYFNLAPGDYVLHIKAYSSNESKGERQIKIHISPPWWKTWWAYSLYGLLVLAGLFMIIRIQKRRVIEAERQRTQAKELAQAKEIEKAYTELKATQAQLIQSEKMASLGELTAGIAHEIQNPLNFVNNFSEVNMELTTELKGELVQMDLKTEDKNLIEDYLDNLTQNEEKINHHGRRADAIVKGMLQHSRVSSGLKESVDINQLVDEYLRLAYHGLRAKDKSFNTTMKTNYETNIGTVNIVPQDIGRVLLNLYNNAFYAVGEKDKQQGKDYEPVVEVNTKRNGKNIEIKIADNGNGIPKKVLDKIFQPFFTTKPTGQGTGLGLSLSFDIVKAHGGEIKVDTVEGHYTAFVICLPA